MRRALNAPFAEEHSRLSGVLPPATFMLYRTSDRVALLNGVKHTREKGWTGIATRGFPAQCPDSGWLPPGTSSGPLIRRTRAMGQTTERQPRRPFGRCNDEKTGTDRWQPVPATNPISFSHQSECLTPPEPADQADTHASQDHRTRSRDTDRIHVNPIQHDSGDVSGSSIKG